MDNHRDFSITDVAAAAVGRSRLSIAATALAGTTVVPIVVALLDEHSTLGSQTACCIFACLCGVRPQNIYYSVHSVLAFVCA